MICVTEITTTGVVGNIGGIAKIDTHYFLGSTNVILPLFLLALLPLVLVGEGDMRGRSTTTGRVGDSAKYTDMRSCPTVYNRSKILVSSHKWLAARNHGYHHAQSKSY